MKVDAKTCRASNRLQGFSERPIACLEMKDEHGIYRHVADIELTFDFGMEVAEAAAEGIAKHFKEKFK